MIIVRTPTTVAMADVLRLDGLLEGGDGGSTFGVNTTVIVGKLEGPGIVTMVLLVLDEYRGSRG